MTKHYSLMNGITFDRVISLLPSFDLMTHDFMKYVSEYWFTEYGDSPELSRAIASALKENWIFGFDICNCMINENNDAFIYYDIRDCETNAIVLGYKGEVILKKIFVDTNEVNERFNMAILSYTEYFNEMARSLGSPFSRLSKESNRRGYFQEFKNDHIEKSLDGDVKLQKRTIDNETNYTTNDHKSGETLHHSKIIHVDKSHDFPHEHIEQIEVQRVKDARLSRGYATDHTYNHFKSQNLPLVSSKEQYTDGHKMWRRLVDKALADGHHVYHWDGTKLHKTTEANKSKHLDNSFGGNPLKTPDTEGDIFEHRHMILSKHEIK